MITRILNVFAALVCAGSVALGAYASHVAEPGARQRLALAALFGFGNALGLLLLRDRQSRLAGAGKATLASGIVLFCGVLAAAGLFQASTASVPLGGSLLILGWLLLAADFARNQ